MPASCPVKRAANWPDEWKQLDNNNKTNKNNDNEHNDNKDNDNKDNNNNKENYQYHRILNISPTWIS